MPYNPKFYDAAADHPHCPIVHGWFSIGQYMGIEYETPIPFQIITLLNDAPDAPPVKRRKLFTEEQRKMRILALKAKYPGAFVPKDYEVPYGKEEDQTKA